MGAMVESVRSMQYKVATVMCRRIANRHCKNYLSRCLITYKPKNRYLYVLSEELLKLPFFFGFICGASALYPTGGTYIESGLDPET